MPFVIGDFFITSVNRRYRPKTGAASPAVMYYYHHTPLNPAQSKCFSILALPPYARLLNAPDQPCQTAIGRCLRLTFLSVVVICVSSRVRSLTRCRRGDRCGGRMTKLNVLVCQSVSEGTGDDYGSRMGGADIDSVMRRKPSLSST
jgi:hypothetical protein